MKPSLLLGLFMAIWGVVVSLPTVGIVAKTPWLVWAAALGWGAVYTRRRLSAELVLVQAGTVAVLTLISAYIAHPDEFSAYPLVIPGIVLYALGYMVVWMAPFGIAHSFISQAPTVRRGRGDSPRTGASASS